MRIGLSTVGLLAAIVVLAVLSAAGAADFTVAVATRLKQVDHAASGALYGIAGPGWPPQDWISAIHPRNFTQMAPGGHQLPNGETAPVGDALVVAPIAAKVGASITTRLPDTFPDFPYIWQGDAFWATEIDRIVKATVAASPPNIYAYEIWNEPDWNWQPQWGDFDATWATSFKTIRADDPSRRILGPSASKWDPGWMRRFLTSAKATGTVPDIVSWHELDPAQAGDIEAHVAAYRALETDLGLHPHPISINEYGSPRAMADPGALVRYIAQLERAGVDTADLAFWHRPGRLSDLLVPRTGGRGPATDPLPTGAWWLYKWYGDMSGSMVAGTPAPGSGLDGFAAYDSGAHRLEIILGGASGPQTVAISGLAGFGTTAWVEALASHRTGTDGASPPPEPLLSGAATVSNGGISVPVNLSRSSDAVELVVTPLLAGQAVTPLQQVNAAATQRVEAKSGTVTGGRKFTIRPAGNFFANAASGEAYVGLFNRAGATLTLPVSVPAAGTYDLALSYSNGQAGSEAVALIVGGTPRGALNLPPTQGRELFGLAHAQVELPAGGSMISLTLAAPVAAFAPGPSVVEFDYVDLSPN